MTTAPMTSFLSGLPRSMAQQHIISQTLTCRALATEIAATTDARVRAGKIARFERLNGERVAMVVEHGLEEWVGTIG